MNVEPLRVLLLGLGVLAAVIVSVIGGEAAGWWFLAGSFFGGYIPLYLMPWIRRRWR